MNPRRILGESQAAGVCGGSGCRDDGLRVLRAQPGCRWVCSWGHRGVASLLSPEDSQGLSLCRGGWHRQEGGKEGSKEKGKGVGLG